MARPLPATASAFAERFKKLSWPLGRRYLSRRQHRRHSPFSSGHLSGNPQGAGRRQRRCKGT